MYDSTLTKEFNGEAIKFNVYSSITYPNDLSPIFGMDVIDILSQDVFELGVDDKLDVVLCRSLEVGSLKN